jgi:hypothetical protein
MDISDNHGGPHILADQYDANEDFMDSARLFCDFIENLTIVDQWDFLKTIQLHLLKIYQKADGIKKADIGSDLSLSSMLSNEQFEKIVEIAKNKLGNYRYYWINYDPINDAETEPVCGDLLDDVGDIYKDLKRSQLLYNSDLDNAKLIAIWHAKFNFENHWGQHCINAIYVCHYFLRK